MQNCVIFPNPQRTMLFISSYSYCRVSRVVFRKQLKGNKHIKSDVWYRKSTDRTFTRNWAHRSQRFSAKVILMKHCIMEQMMLIALTKLQSKMTLRYPAPALLNSSPSKKRKLEALPTPGQSRFRLSNLDLVKRSNLAKTFKLDELCKVVKDISNSNLPGEMGSRALDHLILSCLQHWDQPMTKFF